ncbi:MAG: type IV toxin-antitoxin system AbiEi family antitoxin domain-containing protein [Acidimicrobiales bacterium]
MARGEVEMAALAAAQHGVVQRHQLLELGMSEATVRRRRLAGELVDVQPGVVRHRAHPDTWRGRLLAACLSTGGIASHRSAAILWQLSSIAGGIVEITVAGPSGSRRRGVVVHHSAQMDRADVTTIDGIPSTGVARTLLDLAAVVPSRRLESAVDDALRLRRTSWTELFATVLHHSARGRNGCGPMRTLLAERYGDTDVPLSNWSRQVAHLLLDRCLPPPALEFRITDGSGQLVAQVDLAYPAHRVAIELQSKRWHLNARSFEADPLRWNRLTALGWQVYPFTWAFFVDEPDELCRIVRTALRRPCPDLMSTAVSGDG